MSIKSTEAAPVEPLLGTKAVAYVTRKVHVMVRNRGCKTQLVMMRVVGERHGHGCAFGVEINVASPTVVGETIPLLPTRVAAEQVSRVDGGGEERKNMFLVIWMSDLLRQLGARNMKKVVALCASVDPSRDLEPAT